MRRSQCEDVQAVDLAGATVIVLDTMGELATLYSLCTVAFIGGSLVPIGGHNALEPAVFAKPLLFGPYMHHFPELAALLQQAGGAVQVHGEEELYERLVYLLTHPRGRQDDGAMCLSSPCRESRSAGTHQYSNQDAPQHHSTGIVDSRTTKG